MGRKHLFEIEMHLTDNLPAFTAGVKRQLQSIQSLTAQGGTRSTKQTQGELQRFQGQGLAQLEMAHRRGTITAPDYAAKSAALRKEVAGRASQLGVKSPTEKQFTASYESALKDLSRETKTQAGHARETTKNTGRIAAATGITAAKAEAAAKTAAAKPAAKALPPKPAEAKADDAAEARAKVLRQHQAGMLTEAERDERLARYPEPAPPFPPKPAGAKVWETNLGDRPGVGKKSVASHAVEVGGCGGVVFGRLTPGCPACDEIASRVQKPTKAPTARSGADLQSRFQATTPRDYEAEAKRSRESDAIRAQEQAEYQRGMSAQIAMADNLAGPPTRGDHPGQIGKGGEKLVRETGDQVQIAQATSKVMGENLSTLQALFNRTKSLAGAPVVPGGIEEAKAKKAYDDAQAKRSSAATGPPPKTTIIQRWNAASMQRGDEPMPDASRFARGGQLASHKLLTTAAYGGSGALLYGGMRLGGDILDEAGDLQQELALVKGAFEDTGAAAQNVTFDEYKQNLREISLETGLAVSRVALITRQLSGAFSEGGVPDFEKAGAEAGVAAKFAELTKLPDQEITDSLTAIAKSFDRDFTSIADSTFFVSKSFGVLETNIVQFTADIAPLASELGFTAEQVEGLGGAMQKASGLSGTALAGQASRFLPAIQNKRAEIIRLYAQNQDTAGAIPDLTDAFGRGQIDEVLQSLILNFDKLGKTQQNELAIMIGGRKEASAFFSIMKDGDETLRALALTEGVGAGSLDSKWAERTETVQQQLKKLRATVEDFGIALFQSGIDESLVTIMQTLGLVAKAATYAFKAFGWFDGLPAKLLVAAAAIKVFKMAAGGIASTGRILRPNGLLGRGGAAGGTVLEGRSGVDHLFTDAGGASRARLSKQSFTPKNLGAGLKKVGGALNSPDLALGLSVAALAAVVAYREEIESESDKLGARVAAGIKSGVDIEVYKAQAAAVEQSDRGFFGSEGVIARNFAELIGSRTVGQEAVYRVAVEEEKAKAPGLSAGVKGVTQTKKQKQVIAEKMYDTEYQAGAFKDLKKADQEAIIARIAEVQKNFEEDPTDPGFNKDMKRLANAILGTDYGGDMLKIEAAFNAEQTKKREAIDEAVANQEKKTKAALGVQEAMTQFSLGEIGITALKESFEFESAILAAILKDQEVGSADYLIALTDVRANQQAQREAFAADITKRFQGDQDMMALQHGGVATAAMEHWNLTRTFAEMTMPGTVFSAAQRKQAAKEMTESGYKANEDYVAKGPSATERARRYRTQKNPVSPEAAEAYNRDAFVGGIGGDVVSGLGEVLGMGGQGYGRGDDPQAALKGTVEATDYLMELIKEDSTKVDEKIMERLRESLGDLRERKLLLGRMGETAGEEALAKEIDALQAFMLKSVAIGGAIAGVTTVAPKQAIIDPEVQAEMDRAGDAERISAKYALLKARDRDPIGDARKEVSRLKETLRTVEPGNKEGKDEILAQIIEAEFALDDMLRDRAKKLRDLRWDIMRAHNYKDPLKLAQIDVEQANAAKAEAITPEEKLAAELMGVNADNAVSDALAGIADAKNQYVATIAGDGSVGAAMIQYGQADKAVADAAEGSAAKWQALADRVSASRALRESMMNLFAAQKDLAAALFEASGESMLAARQQLDVANERYRRALAAGDTPEAELAALHAEAVRQQTAITTGERADRLGDLAYLYEFDKITISGYIAKLQQELLAIPESNKEARREIERQIASLREAVGKDLAFNLPSNLKIPTLYEARRLGQSGGGGYQDNRVVTITLTANNAIDGEAAVEEIVNAINGPPRVGISPRSY